ncbi:type VII secretion integral membrane protein EccD [Mycobacterium sp. OAS707]|uniref:type VII secretion integral membrane protein EccD n=1 Tax=Mycobacterium sp. OAS707 TaxID=2663822 RepID=UPI001789FFF8|nr:type VII secretion integral membrane protein EccD [Mycobacterium sp. OAS707]MBE1551560.1 type VII secretion integral membrane protein EccD [Mycobacterium sp. OAS707]
MPDNAVMPIVRVAVLATADDSGRMTDLALPAGLPLREILPAVQRMVSPVSEDGVEVPLSLAPIGGAPFSLDATLDTVGVVDGDLLALQPLPAGPSAANIVEDIADAAALFSAARERPWGTAHIQRAAVVALIGLILVITGLSVAHRLATGAALGLFMAGEVAAATVVAALVSRLRSSRVATALAVAGLAPVAAAFLLAVPGEFGPAQVLLAAAGVTAWSIISITIEERAIAVFTAAAVTAFGVLLPAAAATMWELPTATLGCVVVLFALLVTVQSAQLSALWARFPLPVIPAPGDATPSARPLRVLEDLPRRVRVSESHQTGLIAGGVLLSVVGSLALVGPEGSSPWAWYLVAAAAVGAVLRARVWDSATCKAWLLAHPYLVTVAVVVLFAVTGRYEAAWCALAVLAALVVMWVVVALNPRIGEPDSYSLPMRRLVGFVASAIDASLIPVMAYLAGLFALVLNR